MVTKRFIQLDDGLDFLIKDNLTKEFLSDDGSIEREMNTLWDKTLRFETYTQELADRCIKYEDKISELTIQLKICNENKLFSRRQLEKENQELNKLLDSVENIVKASIQDEKTAFGQMILKQLADKLGVDYD